VQPFFSQALAGELVVSGPWQGIERGGLVQVVWAKNRALPGRTLGQRESKVAVGAQFIIALAWK